MKWSCIAAISGRLMQAVGVQTEREAVLFVETD